jgi:hypothetical protein
MVRSRKRRNSKRCGSRAGPSAIEPRDPLEDIFESGGELFLAVGYTPGGAPFGPRVEIVDGELTFPDELPIDFGGMAEWDDGGSVCAWPPPRGHDAPY